MTKHFEREVEKIKVQLLSLCAVVEETVAEALRAALERNSALAEKVIVSDRLIDDREVEIEEECLKVLALHQPVAIDLRFIVAVLKINNDLERIADLASNIASRGKQLADLPPVPLELDLRGMADKTRAMLRSSIDALVKLDLELAKKVIIADEEIDELNREMYREVLRRIPKTPTNTDSYITYISISRNLERIADSATNIAEDVIYMIEGQIVRHKIKAGESI